MKGKKNSGGVRWNTLGVFLSRSNWFYLVLLAFPAWNVLFYLTVIPDDGSAREVGVDPQLALAQSSSSYSSLGMNSEGGQRYSQTWRTLDEVVREDDAKLFDTYKSFYESRSQSWRIRRYGRVCIVSSSFMGLSLSSGMGTALTTLAESLAKNGFEVTLLYTRQGAQVDVGSIEHWQRYYNRIDVKLVPLPATVNYDVDKDVEVAHRVFMWLRDQPKFDVVHFADNKGAAYFACSAKKQGLDFLQTMLVIHLHCPHMWYKINSLKLLDQVNDLVSDHLERESAMGADYIVSPSHYMINWLQEHDSWSVDSNKVVVQQHIAPKWLKKHNLDYGEMMNEDVSKEPLKITELVYFGRAELKKGIVLFCDALDKLSKKNLPKFSVTFLGQFPDERHQDEFLTLPGNINARIEDYVKHRSVKWTFKWRILQDQRGPQLRIEYMKKPANASMASSSSSRESRSTGAGVGFETGRRLAVMPSIMENSPYSVLECLIAGVPFVATRVGGVEELIPADLHDAVLVDPAAKSVAKRLEAILLGGVIPGNVDYNTYAGQSASTWAIWHHMLKHEAAAFDLSTMHYGTPLVSVCVVTYNNPHLLKQTLQSIEQQDYARLEVIVVDDGSTLGEANVLLEDLREKFSTKGWQVMQQPNRGPGAARNQAAALASGEFLFFMDDDNFAKRDEITTFVNVAAYTGADVLTCVNDYFFGNDPPPYNLMPTGRWVPIGDAKTVGMFQNMYGDTNAMIRKSAFDTVGGFPDDYGYALEDWELFSKSVLSGFRLVTIPLPLYWYRLRVTSHSRTTAKHGNQVRTIRPYLDTIPTSLHHLVLFAQGMKESHDKNSRKLEKERYTAFELQKVVKAMSSSLQILCREGRIQQKGQNLLRNAQFAYTGPTDYPSAGWKAFLDGYTVDFAGGKQSSRDQSSDTFAIKMSSLDWRRTHAAYQEVWLHQEKPEAVVVSGWSKAEKVSGVTDGGYAIYVDIVFKDGSVKWGYTIPFDIGTHSWQFRAGVIDPDMPIVSLQLYCMFRGHTGTVWFDSLSVTLLTHGLCDYTQLVLEGVGT